MKKRFRFLALLLGFMLIFTACSAKETLGEEKARELAAKHIQCFVDGDFDAVTADFSAAVAKQLDAAALEQGWQTVVAMTGGVYGGVHETTYAEQQGMSVVKTVLNYGSQGLVATFAYDAEGKLGGLNLNVTVLETSLTDNDVLTEKEIAIGEYRLTGVVTLPDNVDNYPVAVLVQGSGASDYDETIGANKPFREIAHYLAEKGIATVRVNKRFYQKPETANPETLTIWDEYMDDVYAAIDYAKANVSEDVFVIGHSQGGMSAPKIALDNNLKGIVMMAGTVRGLEDIIYDQNAAVIMPSDAYSDRDKEEMMNEIGANVQAVKALTENSTDAPFGMPAAYWLSLRELDGENILKTTDLPVLIMQGTADFQVYMDKDFEYMKTVLGDRENIIFKAYDGLNHIFMPQSLPGVTDTSEYMAENHIPQYVLDDIADFINNNK